jgi:hypothetical protein
MKSLLDLNTIMYYLYTLEKGQHFKKKKKQSMNLGLSKVV